jgi:hypothetical protein
VSRMQAHLDRHFARLEAAAAVTVTYARDEATVSLSAVPAQTNINIDDGAGLEVRSKRRDWILAAADLVLSGSSVLPVEGDRISVSEGGLTRVYEVQRLAGESHYAPCDAAGNRLRVHSRLVDET